MTGFSFHQIFPQLFSKKIVFHPSTAYLCDMKWIFIYITAAVIAAMLVACRGGDADRALSLADSLMYSRPDSALAILEAVDTVGLSEEQFAHYALLLTKAREMENIVISSDNLIKKAVDYYRGSGDSLETQSIFYYGVNMAHRSKPDSALIIMLQAAELAKAQKDYSYLAQCYTCIAVLFTDSRSFLAAAEMWQKAYEFFVRSGNPEEAQRTLSTLTMCIKLIAVTDPHSAIGQINDNEIDSALKESSERFCSDNKKVSDAKFDIFSDLLNPIGASPLRSTVLPGQTITQEHSYNSSELLRHKIDRQVGYIVLCIAIIVIIVAAAIYYRVRLKKKEAEALSLIEDIRKLETDINKQFQLSPVRPAGSAGKTPMVFLNSFFELCDSMPSGDDGYRLFGKNANRLISSFRKKENIERFEAFINEYNDGIIRKLREQYPAFSEDQFTLITLAIAGFSNQSIRTIMDLKSDTGMRAMKYRCKRYIKEHPTADSDYILNLF